jgi:tetratricopeptide (TPR) repeat protein
MDREADAEMEFVLAAMAKQVAQYPRNPYTLNNLAYALAERGLLLDRALELAIEANERTSYEKPVILDTLAWVLFKKGDFEGAEKIMGTLPAEESDPIYLYHLGAILIAKGDIEQGKALIEQALDEGLHWWDAKHAREILDSLNPSV